MKRIKKNYLLLIISVLLICLISSCTVECINHIDLNDDGICDNCQYQINKDYECPECGTMNSEDSNYCSECGHKVNVLTKCNNCGQKVEGNHKYCTNCGMSLVVKCEHNWLDATYEAPKTCTKCGAIEGEKLECTTHIDENKDLLCDNCGTTIEIVNPECEHNWLEATYLAPKTCTKCGATEGEKLECTTHIDENKDSLCDNCNATIEKPVIKEYKPKWEPNQQTGGWNGNGMEVKIFVVPVSMYDPFDLNYSNPDKKILQKQIRNIEQAYGIDLIFENWPADAPWGPTRVEYIKQMYNNGTLTNNDVYAVTITSEWIPTLVKAGCLAELGTRDIDFNALSGIFTEIGYQETENGEYVSGTYQQNSIYNETTEYLGKIFGYMPTHYGSGYHTSKPRPDYFIYYNADLLKRANMEDPAELWFKGEWTISKFTEYVNELQNNLAEYEYALSIGFPEFVIALTASKGNKIATNRPSLALTSRSVIENFEYIQDLYASGCYERRSFEDVSNGFLSGNVGFVHGELWFMQNENRFNPNYIDFTIGAVPYPTADGDGGIPITTSDVNEALINYNNKPIETYEGSNEYISCVDMSNSSFKIPYTACHDCFSILDTKDGKNGITNKIIFAILYDLYEGLGNDPEEEELTEDEKYENYLKTLFDYQLSIDAIMSVQDCVYTELICKVSMTVGGGSHITSNAFWSLAASICKDASTSPSIRLNEVFAEYRYAMLTFGYNV